MRMKDFKNWLGKKSDTFSALMEEDVTIREVLLVHVSTDAQTCP